MPGSDPYSGFVHRITWLILAIGSAGTLALLVAKGWRFGVGFLLGAGLSYVSFWRWRKVVEALDGAKQKQRGAWIWLLRFAALAGLAYVIVKYLEVTPVAVFLGLLVSAAAVIFSAILELIDTWNTNSG